MSASASIEADPVATTSSHAGGIWDGELPSRLAPWAVPVGLIAAWQLAAQFGWLSSRILPEPLAVLRAAWTLAE